MKKNRNTQRFGDLCRVNTQTYSLCSNWDVFYYLDTGNITENVVSDIQHIVTSKGDKLPSRARRLVKKGDILFSTVRPNQRHYGYIKNVIPHFLVSTGFCVISPKENVDGKYIYYFLTQADVIDKLQAIAEQSTSTYPSVRAEDIANLQINIPSLEEQQKISSILSSLDDKIEVNNQINRNLEEQAKAIFKSWFVDFEPFGGEQPDDWETIHFSSFLNSRREKSSDPSIPLFAVTNTGIIPRDSKFKKNLSRAGTQNKVAYKTDMLFGMSREILNWGIMREEIGCISSAYHVFAVSKDIDSLYLESYIQANIGQFRDLIRPAAREGQGLDQQALMSKTLLLPPKGIISAYHDIADPISAQIQNLKSENIALSTLRDTLLPKLMSGEMNLS
ncbi:MAG: restriction endonuclease subunit S [Lentisphaeria bacterium]|nr:restriction endonuclease subunit S [Lentisphaeria bacterium]